MAIIQTLDSNDIIRIANDYGRIDNFGYDGWKKLFEYMEAMSEEFDRDMELDIVAWCVEYTMCESAQEVFDAYDTDIDNGDWTDMDDEEKLEAIENYLEGKTSVVCCEDDCIIFQEF